MANEVALSTIGVSFTDEQVALLKRTICHGASDDELSLFIAQCKRTKLDPFAKQIHAVKRWNADAGRMVMAIQTGIDGYRLIAERTDKYEGQTPAMWCGNDGVWKDVWLSNEFPAAAKVGVHKAGFKEPVYAVALWTEYKQTKKDGGLTAMWVRMGALMLSKCAESLALRKAFPQELSGIYTTEEMGQADVPVQMEATALPAPTEASEEMQVAWRKLRANLNKSLTAAKTIAELDSKRVAFEDYCKQAETIWAQLTFLKPEETFGMLYDQHKARIDREAELNAPEAILHWIDTVMKSDAKEMIQRISEYHNQDRLQIDQCTSALDDRAVQLGFADAVSMIEGD